MAEKVFQDYQGPVIEINGVCYYYTGETTEAVNSDPSEVGGVYDNCLLCNINSSSSSFGYSSSSSQSFACPDSEPSMVISVTGASGTINWCGETWDLPSQSGQGRIICPTIYNYRTGSPDSAIHAWRYGPDLRLTRDYDVEYSQFTNGFTYYSFKQRNFIRFSTTLNFQDRVSFTKTKLTTNYQAQQPFAPPFGKSIISSSLGFITDMTTGSVARYADMIMLDNFFGSYTDGGITYTWSRGNNWPN